MRASSGIRDRTSADIPKVCDSVSPWTRDFTCCLTLESDSRLRVAPLVYRDDGSNVTHGPLWLTKEHGHWRRTGGVSLWGYQLYVQQRGVGHIVNTVKNLNRLIE